MELYSGEKLVLAEDDVNVAVTTIEDTQQDLEKALLYDRKAQKKKMFVVIAVVLVLGFIAGIIYFSIK